MKPPSDFDVVVETFEKIERARGRNEKLLHLASLAQKPGTNLIVREILVYLLHPHWVYRVRMKNNYYFKTAAKAFDQYSHKYWPAFRAVLDQLKTRELAGSEAREAVRTILNSMSPRYAWFLSNVLNRDMKCGVQWTMYDKSFPQLVPGVEVSKKKEEEEELASSD